jgi:hypothetical protein
MVNFLLCSFTTPRVRQTVLTADLDDKEKWLIAHSAIIFIIIKQMYLGTIFYTCMMYITVHKYTYILRFYDFLAYFNL